MDVIVASLCRYSDPGTPQQPPELVLGEGERQQCSMDPSMQIPKAPSLARSSSSLLARWVEQADRLKPGAICCHWMMPNYSIEDQQWFSIRLQFLQRRCLCRSPCQR